MKVKLEKIVNGKQSLVNLLNQSLPVKTSYRLGKLVSKVERELKDFEAKRLELVKKHGDPVEGDSNKIQVREGNLEEFTKELNELLDVDVDLNFEPVSLDQLADAKLSAVDLNALSDFVSDVV